MISNPIPTISPTQDTALRSLFDVEQQVPLLNGRSAPYINFDNAASTPPLRVV